MTQNRKTISLIFGTRPEAIKLCPLIQHLRRQYDIFDVDVCVTGQHRSMLDQVLDVFQIAPDEDFNLMTVNQSLGSFVSQAIRKIDEYLAKRKPDMVVVQGDTATVFCAALAAFYQNIAVAHVEAGLRTWDKWSPFPEEINRVLTSRLADIHFAPTTTAKDNLLKEGVLEDKITVTGNTVIDALMIAVRLTRKTVPTVQGIPDMVQPGTAENGNRLVLITGHRRENFGRGMEEFCHAVCELAESFSDVHFVYPVHLNPNVREPVDRILRTSEKKNIHLIEPLGYLPFIAMMDRSTLILTDSGGVQEEAPSLGKPVLVTRETTERPEAVQMGTVKLVGTDRRRIVNEVSLLLTDSCAYAKMACAVNPYGDGQACERIAEAIDKFFRS